MLSITSQREKSNNFDLALKFRPDFCATLIRIKSQGGKLMGKNAGGSITDYDKFYLRNGEDNQSFGGDPSNELRKLILLKPGKGKAIDLGCGDGRNSLYLAREGYDVTALDSSAAAIDKLKTKLDRMRIGNRVKPIHEDIVRYNFSKDHYNLAVAITLFDHLEKDDIESIFRKTVESLTENGILLAKVHTIDDPGANGDHEHASELAYMIKHYFRRNELYDLASRYLHVLDYREISEEDRTHGKPHLHSFAIVKARKEGIS